MVPTLSERWVLRALSSLSFQVLQDSPESRLSAFSRLFFKAQRTNSGWSLLQSQGQGGLAVILIAETQLFLKYCS